MAITRRTPRFAQLAEQVGTRLADERFQVSAVGVDRLLNHHITDVAQQMGVTERTALGYTQDSLVDTMVAEVRSAMTGIPNLRVIQGQEQ